MILWWGVLIGVFLTLLVQNILQNTKVSDYECRRARRRW